MTDEVKQTDNTPVTDRPGLRLKRAREAMQLSLDDVARHLKSNIKTIEALENEDTANLPQPIYVSGYLRSYANLVSVSPGEIVEDYPNLTNSDPVIPKFNSSGTPRVKLYKNKVAKGSKTGFKRVLVSLTIVAVAGASSWFYFKDNNLADLVGDTFTEKLDISKEEKIVQVDPVQLAPTNQQEETAQQHIPQQLLPQQLPPQVNTPVEDAVKVRSSRLLLEFVKDSWVEVTDATGQRLEYRLAKAPARRIVEGEAPFKVFLGNAPGVAINYNGLPFDLVPHTDGDVAQFSIGKAEDNTMQVVN